MSSNIPDREPAYSAEAMEAVAQIQDMPRGAAMKRIIGPVITRILSPIYGQEITPEEESSIPPVSRFVDMRPLAEKVTDLLEHRLDPERRSVNTFPGQQPGYSFPGQSLRHHPDYSLLQDVINLSNHQSRLLFSFAQADIVLREGLASGVVVPLTLAAHIHRVEKLPYLTEDEVKTRRLDPLNIVEIMRRNTFDTMLMRLTKGPNGFLGGVATRARICSDKFFNFHKDKDTDVPLELEEAFALAGGQVIDFSALYHTAAEAKRRGVATYHQKLAYATSYPEDKERRVYYAHSSGCPVRHEFTGPDGTPQESLILTAKNFLISALEISARRAATMSEGTA